MASRRNLLAMLISVELILNSVDINFAVFNRYLFPNELEGVFFALFAIDDSGISMQGRSTGFVGPSPQELGFPKEASFFEPAPLVRSRSLPLRALAGEGPVAE